MSAIDRVVYARPMDLKYLRKRCSASLTVLAGIVEQVEYKDKRIRTEWNDSRINAPQKRGSSSWTAGGCAVLLFVISESFFARVKLYKHIASTPHCTIDVSDSWRLIGYLISFVR
jgi:hypothetical protein